MELVLLLQTAQLVGPIPKAGAFRLLVLMVHFRVLFPHLQMLLLVGCQTIVLPYLTLAVAAGPSGLVQSSSAAAFLKHPRTPTGMNGMDCQSEYFQHLMKRICTGQSDDDDGMWTANSHGNATSVVKLGHNTPSLHGLGYTNSGLALLALNASAVHKLWKWQRSERNPSGKRSAVCIALSKNDSYVMSASSGKVSLFNMMTFKVMIMFMPPPPAATYLAFHPQDNNIIAIGMEDSTIQIYNIRVDEVKTKLKGHQNQIAKPNLRVHQNQITGLAFSQTLNALVSSGADAQLCMWSTDRWEKLKSRFIQAPGGRQSPLVGETRVQFHNDQTHLLVVHDSQISIYDSKLECSRSVSFREIAGALDSALTGASLAPVQNSHSDQGKYSNWLSSGLAARKSGSAGSNPGCEWAISAAPDDFIYV
ncbi:hypothetical protein Pint_21672 [Pistacia integerrima]|uniref:Uncharacterized protein n=1 Tax=Pistacia integerrima TaxID=434235 RepID=A0ACC0X840_9ROSI|nr:hypothetical protein Pint_21672 [Pistacia integerrima]